MDINKARKAQKLIDDINAHEFIVKQLDRVDIERIRCMNRMEGLTYFLCDIDAKAKYVLIHHYQNRIAELEKELEEL